MGCLGQGILLLLLLMLLLGHLPMVFFILLLPMALALCARSFADAGKACKAAYLSSCS